MTNVGLVGAGRMAQALARGIIKSGFASPDRLMASALACDQHHLETFSNLGCRTTVLNEEVAKNSDVVILAVKPNIVNRVLNDISPVVGSNQLLVSVASGVTINTIEKSVPAKTRVIRVMPNTPSLVMQGATVFSKGTSATPEDGAIVRRLFTSVGLCEEVPETCMDAVTGLSGSGPAYIYLIIEALADGGVKMGLTRELAVKLAAQCVLGAAKMVLDEGKHPGALKDDVTSPAGCTIHALHLLEQAGLRAIFMSAVEEATKRARQMANPDAK